MNVENSISNENSKYRVECVGSQFRVVDLLAGEEVGIYPTEGAAKEDIERCEKEDAMWDTAKRLFRISVETHMQMHGVDRKTSLHWMQSASESVE